MARPVQFDRNKLHAFLYYKANSRGVLVMNQKLLAAELGISQFHFNRVVQLFVETERLRILGRNRQGAMKTYLVAEPVEFLTRHHDPAGAELAQAELDELNGVNLLDSRAGALKLIDEVVEERKVEMATEKIEREPLPDVVDAFLGE